MGNYSDQPDYATSASNHVLDTVNFTTKLNQSGIYCGSDGDIVVIMAGDLPNNKNLVQFKGLKQGMFLPVIVDYILGATIKILKAGTTFNTGGTIAGAATGDYTFTADVKPNGSTVDGSVEIRMVMSGTTIQTFEVFSNSTNAAILIGGTSVFTIPANALGSNAATNIDIVAGKITQFATSVTDIVTYK